MNECLTISTKTSLPKTKRQSVANFLVKPPEMDPAAIILCAATKSKHTVKCTRSMISNLVTPNNFASSCFLKTWPFISEKLLEIKTNNIALVCEFIATDKVTAWSNNTNVCDAVANVDKITSTKSCKPQTKTSLLLENLCCAVSTILSTECVNASNTLPLNEQHNLSKHSNTDAAI